VRQGVPPTVAARAPHSRVFQLHPLPLHAARPCGSSAAVCLCQPKNLIAVTCRANYSTEKRKKECLPIIVAAPRKVQHTLLHYSILRDHQIACTCCIGLHHNPVAYSCHTNLILDRMARCSHAGKATTQLTSGMTRLMFLSVH